MAILEAFQAGTVLRGRYKIVKIVGKGGMGRVYQAEDMDKKRTVAVKELLHSGLDEQKTREAEELFQQEAKMLEQLRHPNLPRFDDYFSEDGRSFLVMEFIHGKTLARLQAEAPDHQLSVEQVEQYALQLCRVLDYLHSQEKPIIFRDLTPKNVMISPAGQVKLIDFGIARFFKPGQEEDTVFAWTPGFTPPELINEGKTEPRSDQYSLGATLHFCLTAHHPRFNRPLFHFPPVQEYNQAVPDSLNRFILQLVSTDVEKRFSSMRDALETLEQIQQDASATTLHQSQYKLASTTLPGTRRQRVAEAASDTKDEYYNPEKAWLAQFRLWQQRMRKARGFKIVWRSVAPVLDGLGRLILSFTFNQFLPFCSFLGNVCLQILQRPPQKQAKRPPRAHQPPPPPPPAPRPRQSRRNIVQFSQLARLPQWALRQSAQAAQSAVSLRQQHIYDIGASLICLAFLLLATFSLLFVWHSSLHIVALLLSLLLLLLTSGMSALWNQHLRNEDYHYWGRIQKDESQSSTVWQDDLVRYLLVVIEFIVFLFCLTLFIQSDVQKTIGTATPGEALSFILISLALVALVRPALHFRWSDSVLLACIALSSMLLLQNMNISLPFVFNDPFLLINSINIFLAVILLVALGSVIFYHAFLKKTVVLLLAIVFLIQQLILGVPEIGLMLHMPVNLANELNGQWLMPYIINLLVASLPLLITFTGLKVPDGAFLARLSLLVLATGYALLLWFQGSATAIAAFAQPYLPLATQLTVLFAHNGLLIGLLLLLSLATLLRLLLRSGLLQWDFIALFTLAFCSGLLQLTIGEGQSEHYFPAKAPVPVPTIYFLSFSIILVSVLFLLLTSGIVLTALSSMLHLIHSLRGKSLLAGEQTTPHKIPVAFLDSLLTRMYRLILFLSSLICTILQWTAGSHAAFHDTLAVEFSPGLTFSLYHYILFILCLLTLFTGIWCLLPVRKTDGEDGSDYTRYERPLSNRVLFLIGFEALVEVLILSGIPDKQFITVLRLPPPLFILPTFLSSLAASTGWLLLLLLPAIVAIQFSWLRYPFSNWIRKILPCMLGVAFLAALLQLVFPFLAAATLIFLISGTILVARQLPTAATTEQEA